MASRHDEFRSRVDKLFGLTNQLKVQLQVLEESPGSFVMHVQPAEVTPSPDGDIEAVAFLVLMQASKSAQEDLKAIMEQVKDINEAKRKLRATLNPHEKPGLDIDGVLQLMATLYLQESEADLRRLQDHLDSLSELGEVESLRLQMAMDRMSKMMSTLSNLLKKMSDTASAIVQNLK